MNTKFLFGLILYSAALTACTRDTLPVNNQNAQPTVFANAAPNVAVGNNIISANADSAAKENSRQVAKPTPTASAIPKASASPTPAGKVSGNTKLKNYNGTGVVTKINLELVSVELDHEEIKGLMPKMIMEFYVKEKAELERLKVGDAVNFVLEENAGTERIIKIEKR